MKAEIISIGSELVSGQSLDTNSRWLSRELASLGIAVHFHGTVGDHLSDNLDVLRRAVERADLVLITGGLGPTQDDITRDVLANLAGVKLEFHSRSFDVIRDMFARRNRPMPQRNRVQAMFPAGSEPIPNRHGTAPGIWMELAQTALIAMPGVPSEMVRMFGSQVRPRLIDRYGLRRVIVCRKINTFGAGESDIEAKLEDLTRRGRQPEVGITVHDATISLRITAEAESEQKAHELIEPTAQTIHQRLGELVFGEGEQELQDVVDELLQKHGLTLATVEGCTGGLVAGRLTAVAGASRWYRGGLVAYVNSTKEHLCGVPSELFERHGAVSAEVAQWMAEACRSRMGTDLAVSTVGIAGPDGGTANKPVGTLWVALASPDGTTTHRALLFGGRSAIQSRGAKHALNRLRLWLQRVEGTRTERRRAASAERL